MFWINVTVHILCVAFHWRSILLKRSLWKFSIETPSNVGIIFGPGSSSIPSHTTKSKLEKALAQVSSTLESHFHWFQKQNKSCVPGWCWHWIWKFPWKCQREQTLLRSKPWNLGTNPQITSVWFNYFESTRWLGEIFRYICTYAYSYLNNMVSYYFSKIRVVLRVCV